MNTILCPASDLAVYLRGLPIVIQKGVIFDVMTGLVSDFLCGGAGRIFNHRLIKLSLAMWVPAIREEIAKRNAWW